MIEKNKIEGDVIMKSSKTILCTILTIVFIFAGAASAYYPVIDLGTLDGDPNSYAWSVNDSGQIVGWAADGPGNGHACIFDNTGGWANTNLGGTSSGALSNNSSQIVGQSGGHAYIFGVNTDLGTLGGNASGAQSINSGGQIVGWAQNGSGYERACLFDPTGSGNNRDLKTLGGYESEALSINDSNKIVGYADNSFSYERACLFDLTGDSNNNIDLGALGGDGSMAWSVNNNNQIVGWALDGSDNYHACLFDPTGGGANKDLGTLDGDCSEAYSINDNDEVVGYALDSLGQSRACFFDSTGSGNNIDLNTRINPASGWTLLYASSINNEGWIVGQGINSAGQTHAFLLLPEPPIRARVFIYPRILNLRDCGRWVTCYIWLPRGYKVADINPASILLEGEIKAEWTRVMRGWQFMIVKFSRSEVEDIAAPGWVKLTISGKLVNGRKFEGTDVIRVIGKPKHKCWGLPKKCKR
jgi:probable HAF family extracellular repeat protein